MTNNKNLLFQSTKNLIKYSNAYARSPVELIGDNNILYFNQDYDIYYRNLTSGSESDATKLIETSQVYTPEFSISPLQNRVAYGYALRSFKLTQMDGTLIKNYTNELVGAFNWAGDKVVYSTYLGGNAYYLKLDDINGNNLVNVITAGVDINYASYPSYNDSDGYFYYTAYKSGVYQLYKIDTSGLNKTQLTTSGFNKFRVKFNKTHDKAVFVSSDKTYLVDNLSDWNTFTKLEDVLTEFVGFTSAYPVFGEDDKIYFHSNKDGINAIYRCDANTSFTNLERVAYDAGNAKVVPYCFNVI